MRRVREDETGENPANNRVRNFMDDLIMENRAKGSVWSVAVIAIAVFLAVVVVADVFNGAQVAEVAQAQ
ncbi:MAG: hypothetical protein WBO55_00695 [Rhizobiaceae bacterium]